MPVHNSTNGKEQIDKALAVHLPMLVIRGIGAQSLALVCMSPGSSFGIFHSSCWKKYSAGDSQNEAVSASFSFLCALLPTFRLAAVCNLRAGFCFHSIFEPKYVANVQNLYSHHIVTTSKFAAHLLQYLLSSCFLSSSHSALCIHALQRCFTASAVPSQLEFFYA